VTSLAMQKKWKAVHIRKPGNALTRKEVPHNVFPNDIAHRQNW
jgi:hypothetical protein